MENVSTPFLQRNHYAIIKIVMKNDHIVNIIIYNLLRKLSSCFKKLFDFNESPEYS